MKKCDVKGCKENALWFSKTESLCQIHFEEKNLRINKFDIKKCAFCQLEYECLQHSAKMCLLLKVLS